MLATPDFSPRVGVPEALSVTEVNRRAKQLLETSFAQVLVIGEISGVKTVSGHCYFTLKDAASALAAVLFRREAAALKFALRPGMSVLASGRLTLYPPYGRYQMVVERIEPRGAGALQAAFEQLRDKLAQEGLFALERKRPLPLLPRRVFVVTSPTGAVIRDIINVATRRFPGAAIAVVPTRVQGAEAAPEISQALHRASTLAAALGVDAIILARGGGSLEDLWGFNDERVARAVAAASVPVVSAVGHETDFTITDFVADARAPTPSAAAELVFPVRSEQLAALQQTVSRAAALVRRQLVSHRLRIQARHGRLGTCRSLVHEHIQRITVLHTRIERALRQGIAATTARLRRMERRLSMSHPMVRVQHTRGKVERSQQAIVLLLQQRLRQARRELAASMGRLDALSPLGVLQRGYSIVLGPDGVALRDVRQVHPGDIVEVRPASGRLWARVEDRLAAEEEETHGGCERRRVV